MNSPSARATAGLRAGTPGYIDITSLRPPVGAVIPNRNDPAVQEALASAAANRQPDEALLVVAVEGGHALADTDSYLRWWALRNTGSGIGQVRPEHIRVVDGGGTTAAVPDSGAAPLTVALPSPRRAPPHPRGATVTTLPISAITVDPGLQTRASMDPETVAEYAEALSAGIRLPPVEVYRDDDDALLLADGFHRLAAAERAGLTKVDTVTHEGGRRAALLHAVGANARHGLRRTNADKRRCVELLLRDDQWRQRSDVWISQQCGVSDKTVAAVRVALAGTSEVPECPTRKAADGRTMRTARIGRPLAAKPGESRSDAGPPGSPVGADARASLAPVVANEPAVPNRRATTDETWRNRDPGLQTDAEPAGRREDDISVRLSPTVADVSALDSAGRQVIGLLCALAKVDVGAARRWLEYHSNALAIAACAADALVLMDDEAP